MDAAFASGTQDVGDRRSPAALGRLGVVCRRGAAAAAPSQLMCIEEELGDTAIYAGAAAVYAGAARRKTAWMDQ